ncbi:MAG: AAA family ATPase [Phycisphaerae bacterium]|nr:AAA family ATPase [Phycisphaerae bacterium]
MTTLPTSPAVPLAPPRPAVAPPVAAGAAIDPIKLLKRHKWLLLGAAAAGALIGAAANFALEQVYPLWKPIAVFRCNAPIEQVGQTGAMMNAEEMNRFMQTQIKVMTSDRVLGAVVDDPRLRDQAKRWCDRFRRKDPGTGELIFNNARALRILSDDVVSRPYPNTSLLELSYSHRYKEDATIIVGLVKEKYMAELARQGQGQLDERTRSIREALARVDREVSDLQNKRKTMIENERIESIDEKVGAAQNRLQQLEQRRVEIVQDLTGAISQRAAMTGALSNPRDFPFDDDVKQEADRDPVVMDMRNRISNMKAELSAMRDKGQTQEHREYKAMVARIAGAEANLQEITIEAQQRIFNSQLERLNKAIGSLTAQEAKLTVEANEARQRLIALNRLSAELADIARQIDNLLKTKADQNARLQDIISVSQLASFNRVEVYQPETIPTELSFPKLKFMIPLGILLSVGLVGAFVVVREIADQRIKGPADINLVPRARLLGWVPDAEDDPEGKGAPETAFRDRPRGLVAESYRQLRTAFLKRIEPGGHKVILVLSGTPGAGSTSVVANLALALAAADRRVLVIDSNLRRPTMHRVFGLQESPGLADVLTEGKPFETAVQKTSTPGVDFLSAGTKELRIVERLAARAKGDIIAGAKEAYDVVLIDVAPAVVAGDGLTLAQRADATMLVVRAMADKRGMVGRIASELSNIRSEFLGVIVNGVRASSGGYLRGNIRAAAEYAKAE